MIPIPAFLLEKAAKLGLELLPEVVSALSKTASSVFSSKNDKASLPETIPQNNGQVVDTNTVSNQNSNSQVLKQLQTSSSALQPVPSLIPKPTPRPGVSFSESDEEEEENSLKSQQDQLAAGISQETQDELDTNADNYHSPTPFKMTPNPLS